MKSRTLPIVLTLTFFITACDKMPKTDKSAAEEGGRIEQAIEPKNYKLTNKSGTTIDVRIIAHDNEDVVFMRLSDSKTFRWKINQLAKADQTFVRSLPVSSDLSSYGDLSKSTQISNRKIEKERLSAQLSELYGELEELQRNSRNSTNPRIRGLEKQIEMKKKQLSELDPAAQE